MGPRAFQEGNKFWAKRIPEGCAAVVLPESLSVFALPVRPCIDLYTVDSFREAVNDGNGEPLPAILGPYAVAILPFVFLELHCVQKDEDIGRIELVEIAQPGTVLRLVNGDLHRLPSGAPEEDGIAQDLVPGRTTNFQSIEQTGTRRQGGLNPA